MHRETEKNHRNNIRKPFFKMLVFVCLCLVSTTLTNDCSRRPLFVVPAIGTLCALGSLHGMLHPNIIFFSTRKGSHFLMALFRGLFLTRIDLSASGESDIQNSTDPFFAVLTTAIVRISFQSEMG